METQTGVLIYVTDLLLGEGQEGLLLRKNVETKPTGLNRKRKTFRKIWAAQLNSRMGSRSFPTLLWRRVLCQVQAGLSAGFTYPGDHLLRHTLASSGRISIVISGSLLPSVFSLFVRVFLLHPPLHWVGVACNSEETHFWGELG